MTGMSPLLSSARLRHPGLNFLVSCLLACAILLPSLGRASDHQGIHDAMRRGEIVSLAAIRAHALRHFGGRIIEVELERSRGGAEYELELLIEDGRVVELTYDARTGRLIGVEGQSLETVFGRGGRPLP